MIEHVAEIIAVSSGQIDTVVHVYHGPLHYEDSSGYIATQDDWFDPHGGPRAWFTEEEAFREATGIPFRGFHFRRPGRTEELHPRIP